MKQLRWKMVGLERKAKSTNNRSSKAGLSKAEIGKMKAES
jgi:hypothetical protein